jgi:hypothetical protein
MNRMRSFIICLLLALMTACATAPLPAVPDQQATLPPQPVKSAPPPPAPEEKNIFKDLFNPKDEELFLQGLSLLPEAAQKNDYDAARNSLQTLINTYKESKWRHAASAVLSLIGEIEICRDKIRLAETSVNKISADKQRAGQEIDQIKKELRLLNEKSQTEITALQQENEQLKKDLQLLKDLEIQLEKREKPLR